MSVEIISTENLNEAKGLWAISPNNFNGLIGSHILANQRIAELEAQLSSEQQTWRCFHCGFDTSDKTEASGHFGEFGEEYPLCIHWSDLDADSKASEFQRINAELEGEREENLKLRQQVEQLEYLTGSQEADISSRFKGCRTINEAFFKYDSMEGRMLVAEEKLAARDRQLKTAREALEELDSKSSLVPHWTSHLSDACLSNCPRCLVRKALAALDGEM